MAKTISSNHGPEVQRQIDFLRQRSQAYNQVFARNIPTETVLDDLARFCRAGSSTFDPDPRVHALLEGRKEVWTRIANHLNMTEDQLYAVYVLGSKHVGREG